jgi:EAL domain-containing protein (putative c-di-GMP-specific phosphodiesterase class I)
MSSLLSDRPVGSDVACKGNVLLVEDEPAILRAYGQVLRRAGFEIEGVADVPAALEALRLRSFDAVLSDIALPSDDGIAVLRFAHERDPDLPVVLMTGSGDLQSALKAVEHGALRYLLKPVEPNALVDTVNEAVRLRKIAQVKRRAYALYGAVAQKTDHLEQLTLRFQNALNTLHMAYQPIVSWSARSCFAHEALVRNSDEQLRRPDLLIAAAEELGRLFELGRKIRGSVAETIRTATAPILIFMNLHPRDLLDEQLYDADAPLSRVAKQVVLEITERASLVGIADLQSRLAALRELGFRLALDDLGAGYAGLTSFAQMRPDVVKLDMSLTRGVDKDPTKRKLVQAMCDLCREFGMLVVIEGVETDGEKLALVELGCDLLQGYLFARPAAPFPPVVWNEEGTRLNQ